MFPRLGEEKYFHIIEDSRVVWQTASEEEKANLWKRSPAWQDARGDVTQALRGDLRVSDAEDDAGPLRCGISPVTAMSSIYSRERDHRNERT